MSIKPKNSYLKVTYNKAPFTTYPNLLATLLVQTFDIKKGDKLLDLGCGRGEFLRGFLDCGVEGYGIDQADSAKSLCPEATIVVGDLEKTLPFERKPVLQEKNS